MRSVCEWSIGEGWILGCELDILCLSLLSVAKPVYLHYTILSGGVSYTKSVFIQNHWIVHNVGVISHSYGQSIALSDEISGIG